MLQLDRPLCALDVETDGYADARIVEIGFELVYPTGAPPLIWSSLVNPGRPMKEEAIAVHCITDGDLANAPGFHQLARNLLFGFQSVDFCGHSVKSDLKILEDEFKRCSAGTFEYGSARILDSYRLWQKLEPRTLDDAVARFLLRKRTSHHRALIDAQDSLEVVRAIALLFTERTEGNPVATSQLLHDFAFPKDPNSFDPDGKCVWKGTHAVLTFGKFAQVPLQQVDRNYFRWMASADFDPALRRVANEAYNGIYPKGPPGGAFSPTSLTADADRQIAELKARIGEPPPPAGPAREAGE